MMNLFCIILVAIPIVASVSCVAINEEWEEVYVECLTPKPKGRPPSAIPLPPKITKLDNSKEVPEEFSRHHVIPWHRIRDFFSLAFAYAKTDACISMMNLMNRIVHRTSKDGQFEDIEKPNLEENVLMRLFKAVTPKIRNDILTERKPENFAMMVHAFFCWFPANIFLGPSSEIRSDDPGEDFEESSKNIIDEKLFTVLKQANDLMIVCIRDYGGMNNKAKQKSLQDILNLLGSTFVHTVATPYNRENWYYNPTNPKKKWSIKVWDVAIISTDKKEVMKPNEKPSNLGNKIVYKDIYNCVKHKYKNICLKAKTNNCNCDD